jgi:hypothetical protein
MKGYKAYDKPLTCKGFKFEEGKEYKEDKAICCYSGFHFCENPLDVLNYYNLCESDFTEIEAIGNIHKNENSEDTKAATDKIKIGAKLDLAGFIKASFSYISEKCKQTEDNGYSSQLASSGYNSQLASSGSNSKLASSGYNSQLASSGYSSQLASSGHNSQLASSGYSSKLASSGHNSQLASSGHNSQLASSGYSSKLASSGHNSKLTINGENSVGAAIGINSKIKSKIGNWITLAEWKYQEGEYVICSVKSAQVDGVKVKADTWYELIDGDFKEVED